MRNHACIALFLLLLALPAPVVAEEAKEQGKSWPDIGLIVQSAVDYAWKQFLVPPIRKHALDWLKTWEGRELDGKHLKLLEVKGLHADLPTSPRMETLDKNRVAVFLPGEGTWNLEIDLKVHVDYGFLFWRWKDDVDLTLRLEDLRSTVVLDISDMRPGGAGLVIDEVVLPSYKIDIKSDHRFVKKFRERILKKLDTLAAQYIRESQEALARAKAERLAATAAKQAPPRAQPYATVPPQPASPVASSRKAPTSSR